MDCLKFYNDSMQNSIHENESFFTELDLQQIHQNKKRETFAKVSILSWTISGDQSEHISNVIYFILQSMKRNS